MVDPLSIVGSVAGVASLGIQVTQSLIDFYNTYKHQSSDLARTFRNLEDLTDTLRNLEKIWVGRILTENDQCLVDRIQRSITNCTDTIDELYETCQKFTRPRKSGLKESLKIVKHQAAYPFKKSTLQKLDIDIAEIRDNLTFLLDVVQLKATEQSQDDLDELKALLESIDGRQISSTLRGWLNAPDATVDHNAACEKKKKNPGSGTWLFENPQYSGWLRQEKSFLWLNGFAGSGKSVLCSTAIQSAFRHRRGDRNVGIAFFYFTFNDKSKQEMSSMVRALLWQLSSQVPDGPTDLSQLHEAYQAGTPPSAVLLAYLQRLIGRFDRTYIFLDALDECSRTEGREGVLDTLEEMRKWDVPNIQLFVTSRDESDIRRSLTYLAHYQIEMRNTGIDGDIANFVSRQLNEDQELLKLSKYHNQIRTALTEDANGVEDRVQQKLKSLPKSLDATYEQILCNIDEDFIEDARRILTLLCFAYRPLTTRELIDGIAVDIRGRTGLNRSRRLQDVDDIRDICSGLLDVDIIGDPTQENDSICHITTTVRIAHFSVQEYLESARILQSNAKPFSMDRLSAHSEIAQICLVYLLEDDLIIPPLDEPLIEQFPLSHFAATYWHHHYRDAAGSTTKLEELVLNLFQRRQSVIAWVKLHDVERNWDNSINFDRQPSEIATSIYYVSLLGLEKTLWTLISEQPATAIFEQVNTQSGMFGNALEAVSSEGHQGIVQILFDKNADANIQGGHYGNALQAASYQGHQGIVQMLLDKNADVNTQGGYYGNALQAASCEGHQSIVQMLLDKNADANAEGGIYGNALCAASFCGHQSIVQMLLDKNADVYTHLQYCGNALQAALCEGHLVIAQMLFESATRKTDICLW